jgi:hypothetical protein
VATSIPIPTLADCIPITFVRSGPLKNSATTAVFKVVARPKEIPYTPREKNSKTKLSFKRGKRPLVPAMKPAMINNFFLLILVTSHPVIREKNIPTNDETVMTICTNTTFTPKK